MPDKGLSGIYGYELFGKSMQLKILPKRILLIVAFTGLTLFLSLLFYSVHKSSIQSGLAPVIENAAAIPNPEQASSGLPVRLKIPKINVDAAVKYLSLTPQGAMDVPKGPTDIAWFNLGPPPGERGSSVIAGHYSWKNNIPAVFDNLHKLRKGDKIYIKDDKGSIISFVVREIQIYGKNEDASGVFGSSDGKAHLNLITCTGVWNKAEKTRSDRLIVFTDKE